MPSAWWLLLPLAMVAFTGPPPATRPAHPPTFRDDVLPLLQRHGCSSAYCHGSATGRGGFKLSLFGSDPDADWRALAVDLGGRRLDLRLPEQSLLLRKASRRVPHAGGERLARDQQGHATIAGWIAAGAPRGPAEPWAERIEVRVVADRAVVEAVGADGSRRDVSAMATFASSEETVATVAADGALQWAGPGEVFVTARHAGLDAVVRVVRPLGAPVAGAAGPAHAADRAWRSWLGELGLEPGPPAPPHRLVRRLYLDLVGRPPAPHEVRAFEQAPAATAVATTVDRLLATTAFTATFAEHLCAMLELPDPAGLPAMQADGVRSVRERVTTAVADRMPLDDLAGELLAAGSPLLERVGDPRDRAEFVGRAFLGMQIGCARCHDHPHDRWRQRDHQGFAALLATRRGAGGALLAGAVFDEVSGAACAPRMLPLAPSAPAVGDDPVRRHAELRRVVLHDGEAFARNVGNRLLGVLLGRAPVEPVDDHRATNPPRCAPLLAAAVAEHRRTRGDLRAMVRWIATSALYAVDSEPTALTDDAWRARWWARQQARPLPAPLLARALAYVLDARAGEPLPTSPLAQQLRLRHGDWLPGAVAGDGGAIDVIAATMQGDDAVAETFLAVLSRPPRAEELAALAERMRLPPLRDRLVELAHALCLTREFGSRR